MTDDVRRMLLEATGEGASENGASPPPRPAAGERDLDDVLRDLIAAALVRARDNGHKEMTK